MTIELEEEIEIEEIDPAIFKDGKRRIKDLKEANIPPHVMTCLIPGFEANISNMTWEHMITLTNLSIKNSEHYVSEENNFRELFQKFSMALTKGGYF